ncbi:heme lyase CcmF/NrfE family subunit [Megalodesulfovibrio paquesii]
MHLLGYWTQLACLLLTLGLSAYALILCWNNDLRCPSWLERGHLLASALLTLGGGVLLAALVERDYSFALVADYTDDFLPLFYRITAFWAGQAGSLYFWAWMTALFCLIFQITPAYARLSQNSKLHFWLFHHGVMAFFLLLLTSYSNPFTEVIPAPHDGNGLNPLLQNPGMIFHPPLLFLGYAGFTIPACLALGQTLAGEFGRTGHWTLVGRPYAVSAWVFLTAGIILGGWWSYMELGWGGYWAWDPVENASLIPWFAGTAVLHTTVLQSRRGVLPRANVFLIGLTLVTCFFATYLVRSGVVESLHAFGKAPIGVPLLLFMIATTIFMPVVIAAGYGNNPAGQGRELAGLASREGMLILAVWALLALGLVVLLGTMWPVISKLWSANTVGLDQTFYNKVCMPFFVIIALLLSVCPWISWQGGVGKARHLALVGATFAGLLVLFYVLGYTKPVALVGAAAGGACLLSLPLLLVTDKAARKLPASLAAHLVHIGLAMMVVGVAFSGPYQEERQVVLKPGETTEVAGFTFKYEGLREFRTDAMAALEATIIVEQDGKLAGSLLPQRRIYQKFPNAYAEASTIFSLGTEVYATLLGAQEDHTASFTLSAHPLVNWLWIGGTIMCLAPFWGIFRGKNRGEQA